MNRLAALTAAAHAEAGSARAFAGGVPAGLAEFARSYLLAGGWREGRDGFLLAILSGLHPVLVASRMREAQDGRRPAATPRPLTPVLELGAR
ncbi:hypothetical protein [Phenylobacterium sp. J367]|uniref:hypothetical protein n=1 Tax=Phenylobacterium sp. J367 TaxID=2898435 RepID=UPI0021515B00|nr:hypothetical protein [Phenylobacterium sp. J367]MCR5879381.1 hypothetical protein [Phenylobacterium sp. J367]